MNRTVLQRAGIAAGLGLLGLTILLRGGSDTPDRDRPVRKPVSRSAARPIPERREAVPPAPPVPRVRRAPRPANPRTVAQKTEDVRLRSTYRNFRTAVATGNRVLESRLKAVLEKDLDRSLRWAREDLESARSEGDRRTARLTLDHLRR